MLLVCFDVDIILVSFVIIIMILLLLYYYTKIYIILLLLLLMVLLIYYYSYYYIIAMIHNYYFCYYYSSFSSSSSSSSSCTSRSIAGIFQKQDEEMSLREIIETTLGKISLKAYSKGLQLYFLNFSSVDRIVSCAAHIGSLPCHSI